MSIGRITITLVKLFLIFSAFWIVSIVGLNLIGLYTPYNYASPQVYTEASKVIHHYFVTADIEAIKAYRDLGSMTNLSMTIHGTLNAQQIKQEEKLGRLKIYTADTYSNSEGSSAPYEYLVDSTVDNPFMVTIAPIRANYFKVRVYLND